MRVATRCLVLVPASQVKEMLDEINDTFLCRLTLPKKRQLGFVLRFGFGGTPKPHFLGQCNSKGSKDKLEARIGIPQGDYDDYDKSSPVFLEFEEMLETGLAANKNKKKGSSGSGKLKREHIRLVSQRESAAEMRRSQCYFGLRPSENVDGPDDLEGAGVLPPLKLDEKAPCEFFNAPIFICVDVECNERIHSQVTEVGISTLDTLDLDGVPPGENSENWRSRIQSRHLRTREYAHVVNREFLQGCPDEFEFGESEWVSLRNMPEAVDACFWPPYSHGQRVDLKNNAVVAIPVHKLRNRRVILVGHDPSADIRYLKSIGAAAVRDRSNEDGPSSMFLDILDTATLFRTIRGEANTRSLGNVLNYFKMTGWYLHNAGNDARYTMEAMVQIAVHSRRHVKEGSGQVSPTMGQVPRSFAQPTATRTVENGHHEPETTRMPNDDVMRSEQEAGYDNDTTMEGMVPEPTGNFDIHEETEQKRAGAYGNYGGGEDEGMGQEPEPEPVQEPTVTWDDWGATDGTDQDYGGRVHEPDITWDNWGATEATGEDESSRRVREANATWNNWAAAEAGREEETRVREPTVTWDDWGVSPGAGLREEAPQVQEETTVSWNDWGATNGQSHAQNGATEAEVEVETETYDAPEAMDHEQTGTYEATEEVLYDPEGTVYVGEDVQDELLDPEHYDIAYEDAGIEYKQEGIRYLQEDKSAQNGRFIVDDVDEID